MATYVGICVWLLCMRTPTDTAPLGSRQVYIAHTLQQDNEHFSMNSVLVPSTLIHHTWYILNKCSALTRLIGNPSLNRCTVIANYAAGGPASLIHPHSLQLNVLFFFISSFFLVPAGKTS